MGEVRQNRLNGQWIIYAPRKGEGPRDYRRQEQNPSALPEYDAGFLHEAAGGSWRVL